MQICVGLLFLIPLGCDGLVLLTPLARQKISGFQNLKVLYRDLKEICRILKIWTISYRDLMEIGRIFKI